MDRRKFLRAAIAGSATALADASGAASPAASAETSVARFELEEVSITDLQRGMQGGRWTARTITEAYLSRIAELDQRGPALHSLLDINPDALAIADRLDAERRAGQMRGPLHGIPIVVKDNIDTADRMTTTAGSLALEGSFPAQDATVAGKLRDAGAILLAKANLSEWANFRSDKGSSGWSARGGQCRNPYALDRNPGGSSAGSGAAIAANLAAAAIGTETDGSIVSPSNNNGLVGIKPTVGLVSRAGIIPISYTQDTAGPMARTVADAAILLGVIAGPDPRDGATRAGAGKAHPDYTRFLDPGALAGARIGVARQYFGFNRDVDTLMDGALAVMKAQGAVLVDPVKLTPDREFGDAELTVLLFEFKAGLDAYLQTLPAQARVRSLADVIAFNERTAVREMPYFGQELFVMAQAKGPLSSKEYTDALDRCRLLSRRRGIDGTMAGHRLDAVVGPTSRPAWVTDLVNGDRADGGTSSLAAVAGYPHVTVPAGFVRGLPVGVSFFGRAWSEPKLIGLAYAFEQATRVRRPPGFLATAAL
jgi:amidase